MAILISDKKIIQTRSISRDKGEISKIMKWSINQKDIMILTLHETYNKESKYIMQKVSELKINRQIYNPGRNKS